MGIALTVSLGDSQSCSPFQLSPELLKALEPLSEPASAKSEDLLVRQGTPCRGVYIVQTGLVRLSILSQAGREVFKRLLGPRCVIGLPATLCSTPYTFSAQCQTDCVLQFVAGSAFLEFMRTQPRLGMEIVRLMGQELTEMQEQRTNFQNCRDCGCSFADICEHELGRAGA